MTPLPKKKHSKARSRVRHSTRGINLPSLISCANCGSLRFPHRFCPNCGKYVNETKEKVTQVAAQEPPKA